MKEFIKAILCDTFGMHKWEEIDFKHQKCSRCEMRIYLNVLPGRYSDDVWLEDLDYESRLTNKVVEIMIKIRRKS